MFGASLRREFGNWRVRDKWRVPAWDVVFQLGIMCSSLACRVPAWNVVFQLGMSCSSLEWCVPAWNGVFQLGMSCSSLEWCVPAWHVVFQLGMSCSSSECRVPLRILLNFIFLCFSLVFACGVLLSSVSAVLIGVH